jgi:polyisoprenoid-binding protein YceI
MKYSITLVLLVFSMLLANAQSSMQISSAEVRFTFVDDDVTGTLTGFTSESSIDFEQIENSRFSGSVEVETISTGNSFRNWSLRLSKYFDANTYPRIAFESTSVQQEGNSIVVKGILSLKNSSKEISFRFEKKDKQLIGKTTVYSSDFGIHIKSEREKNKVLVVLIFKLK